MVVEATGPSTTQKYRFSQHITKHLTFYKLTWNVDGDSPLSEGAYVDATGTGDNATPATTVETKKEQFYKELAEFMKAVQKTSTIVHIVNRSPDLQAGSQKGSMTVYFAVETELYFTTSGKLTEPYERNATTAERNATPKLFPDDYIPSYMLGLNGAFNDNTFV